MGLCGNRKCRVTGAKLRNCARCRAVGYCSRDCQKEQWTREHKEVCREGLRAEMAEKVVKLNEKAKILLAADGEPEELKDLIDSISRLDVDSAKGKEVRRSVREVEQAMKERLSKRPKERALFGGLLEIMRGMDREEAETLIDAVRDMMAEG